MDIQNLRRNYSFTNLLREDLKDNPFDQFNRWFEDTVKAAIIEPNAMALATVSKEGRPSCRMVLMKTFDERGLVFYTNLKSRKAQELTITPFAAVTFFWKELERQVLIEGLVEPVDRQEAQAYFLSRPRGSQLSAWASRQDQVIHSRQSLEENYQRIEEKYVNQEIPLPEFWGGFRLSPERFEFWQGRPDRLHDRFVYRKNAPLWTIDRLSP